tara:strand:+ start:495 stop:1355 length:861 start_codon:yes stop_codon:yes gene_type:complete
MKIRIKRFDPSTLKPHRIILVVGKRGTGKSVMQRDLMYHMCDKVDFGLAFSPTEETQDMFREHMPDSWIYNGFSSAKLDTMLQMQRDLCRQKKQRNLFIIMDDCMYDKKILKGLGIRDLFMNGRHMHITLCNAVQYVMDIGPDLRTQVDYVFALRENIISNKSKLWKYFFGMFEKYDDFAKVMDKCTANHGALVMDNTTGSCNVEDCIFWYKAEFNLPEFKFGSDIFHKISKKYVKSEQDRLMEELEQKEMEKMMNQTKEKKRISCVQMEDGAGNVLLEKGIIKLN